jgi:hypothetical protein
MVKKTVSLIGQVICYAAFAAFIGYFSTSPRYTHLAPDRALIKVSMSHFGAQECRMRTPEEIAALPPNMRAPKECKRERSPLILEIDLDGQPVVRDVIEPSGIRKDGVATTYRRFEVPAGEHRLAVRMNDDARIPGFNHVKEGVVQLKPAQIVVIDFNPEKGGLFFN